MIYAQLLSNIEPNDKRILEYYNKVLTLNITNHETVYFAMGQYYDSYIKVYIHNNNNNLYTME